MLKLSFKSFLHEGRNSDLAKLKLDKAGLSSVFNDLLKIDTSKNNKNLPKLVDYYIEVKDIDIIKGYYERFMVNTSLNTKDINAFKTFKDFENIVDSTVTKVAKTLGPIEDAPIFEDDNIKVFLGDSKEQCIKLSDGYTFCIGRKDSSNLYSHYRFKSETTFYFIRFKDKENNKDSNGSYVDDEHYIVVQALTDGRYFITMANNVLGDTEVTREELIEKYPLIKVLFENGVIKPIKFTEKEKHLKDKIHGKAFSDIKSVDDQILWIETNPGKQIGSIFNGSTQVVTDEVLKKYIEVGHYDLYREDLDKLKDLNPKLFERYKEVRARNFDIKSKANITSTLDELYYAKEPSIREWLRKDSSKNGAISILSKRGFRDGSTVKLILEEVDAISFNNIKYIYDLCYRRSYVIDSEYSFQSLFSSVKTSDNLNYGIVKFFICLEFSVFDSKERLKNLRYLDSEKITKAFEHKDSSLQRPIAFLPTTNLDAEFLDIFLEKVTTEISGNFVYYFCTDLWNFKNKSEMMEIFLRKVEGVKLLDPELGWIVASITSNKLDDSLMDRLIKTYGKDKMHEIRISNEEGYEKNQKEMDDLDTFMNSPDFDKIINKK